MVLFGEYKWDQFYLKLVNKNFGIFSLGFKVRFSFIEDEAAFCFPTKVLHPALSSIALFCSSFNFTFDNLCTRIAFFFHYHMTTIVVVTVFITFQDKMECF